LWAALPERFALAQAYHEVAEVIGWDRTIDFGMTVWETMRPPSRRKKYARDCSGVIYIPQKISEFSGVELVKLVGREDADRLVARFRGTCLWFPNIEAASISHRNRAIARQVAEGRRAAVVACLFDLNERSVRRIVRQESSRHVHKTLKGNLKE
jgi:hypothetical protein